MFDTHDPEVAFALAAVREAAGLAASIQRDWAPSALTKGDNSPVTVADFAAQAVVGARLEAAFPDAVLVAEEDSGALALEDNGELFERVREYVNTRMGDAAPDTVRNWIDRGAGEPGLRFWTLDPIDGTKGFLRGAQYAVALALIQDGQVELAVLGCPNLTGARTAEPGGPGTLVVARRGQGTWWTPLTADTFEPLRVSSRRNWTEARLLRSAESAHTNVGRIGRLIEHLGIEAPAIGMDSQAKYALLAAGEGDLLVRLLSASRPDYEERIWDQAAGSLVLEEAGGRITDLKGRALDFTAGRTLAYNRGVLASNRLLHEDALEALRACQIV